jgi:threonine/homoserine/homoserine lactone efflux protein
MNQQKALISWWRSFSYPAVLNKRMNPNVFLISLAAGNVVIHQFMDPMVKLNVLLLMHIMIICVFFCVAHYCYRNSITKMAHSASVSYPRFVV